MDSVISELCYKGTILQRNYIIPDFAKFNRKKINGNHNMTMLYPNPCFNKYDIKGLYCNMILLMTFLNS